MDIKTEILKLQKSRLLRNPLEINDFESAIENIVSLKDVSLTKDLCSGFDDKTEDHEVMFGLVHAIEDFDGEEGILEMIKAIPSMLPHAKEWAVTLNYRTLNHEPSRKLYIEGLKNVDVSVRNTIVQILKEIKSEDPIRFEALVNEVLSSLN
jgi:hypothetical protein